MYFILIVVLIVIKRKGYKIDSLNSNFGGKISRKNFKTLGEWLEEQKKFSLAISGYIVIELCVCETGMFIVAVYW